MNEEALPLRRADELELRGVLAALRLGGRFVIVVAEEAIWPAVREVLERGLGTPVLAEVRLVTGEDVVRVFSSEVVTHEGTVVLHIGEEAAGAIEALNLHRDKLRQKQCWFVLRLDRAAAHERFVRAAPDCYSVRDALAVVDGRPVVAPPERGVKNAPRAEVHEDLMDFRPLEASIAAAKHLDHEDVRRAREALTQMSVHWWEGSGHRDSCYDSIEINILIGEGHWEESERRLRASLAASNDTNYDIWCMDVCRLARLLAMRGELEAALDVLGPVDSYEAESLRVRIQCSLGAPEAVQMLAVPLCDQLLSTKDIHEVLAQACDRASAIRTAVSAGQLESKRSDQLDAELDALAAHVTAVALLDPPWSRINVELLVADNLLARAGAEPKARAAAERALALARTGAPEQIPRCVRHIAVAALRTGALVGLAELLDEASAAAEKHHLPGEAARIAGLRLWLTTRLGGDVAGAEQALNEAIERTGSVLVEAEALYKTGRGAGRRDLIERSRRIYRSLPWPEREGECLEALGMKEAARTRYEAFGLRLAALALERRTGPAPLRP